METLSTILVTQQIADRHVFNLCVQILLVAFRWHLRVEEPETALVMVVLNLGHVGLSPGSLD